jgi:hypothetical protein
MYLQACGPVIYIYFHLICQSERPHVCQTDIHGFPDNLNLSEVNSHSDIPPPHNQLPHFVPRKGKINTKALKARKIIHR